MSDEKKCKHCAMMIPKEAKVCPYCRKKLGTSNFVIFILIIASVWIFYRMSIPSFDSYKEKAKNIPTKATTAPTHVKPTTPATVIPKENWIYTSIPYSMGEGEIKQAYTESVNILSFGFPYDGLQRATLILRKHPQYGNDVILKIEKGQFLLGVNDGEALVRCDDGPAKTYKTTGPTDHSTEMIFISDYSTFVTTMKKAKKLKIQATIYNEGNQIFEFNVHELNW